MAELKKESEAKASSSGGAGKILVAIGIACGVIALLVVGLCLVGFALPPASVFVSRSVTINAPPAAIHPFVNNLEKWPDWTVWTEKELPGITYTYGDDSEGVGAVQKWTGDSSGGGRLEITRSDPQAGVAFEMQFEGYQHKYPGEIKYEQVAKGTKVTWTGEFDMEAGAGLWTPAYRWSGMMMDMENTIGAEYEAGLENLKKLVESQSQPGDMPPSDGDGGDLPAPEDGAEAPPADDGVNRPPADDGDEPMPADDGSAPAPGADGGQAQDEAGPGT